MYDGTLRLNWKALVTFQQMIVLCDVDGVVDMTPFSLHGRTGIPLEIIEEGIEALEAPDPQSRTSEFDGRRLERLDAHRPWGWVILNYKKYRHLTDTETVRAENRERQRRHRDKSRAVTDGNAPSLHAEVEAEVEVKKETTHAGLQPATMPNCPKDEILALYHDVLPKCPRVLKWTDTRDRLLRARWREHPSLDQWKQYFSIVSRSRFLTGKTNGHVDRPPFIADLEWLIKPSNFVKVMEGRYDNR